MQGGDKATETMQSSKKKKPACLRKQEPLPGPKYSACRDPKSKQLTFSVYFKFFEYSFLPIFNFLFMKKNIFPPESPNNESQMHHNWLNQPCQASPQHVHFFFDVLMFYENFWKALFCEWFMILVVRKLKQLPRTFKLLYDKSCFILKNSPERRQFSECIK